MVSACKPSNAKLTLFAKLNYLPSCSHKQPSEIFANKIRSFTCVISFDLSTTRNKLGEYFFPRHFSKSIRTVSKGFPKCFHILKGFKAF